MINKKSKIKNNPLTNPLPSGERVGEGELFESG